MTDDYRSNKDGDDSGLSEVPETTDFSRAVRGPFLDGMRILRFRRRHRGKMGEINLGGLLEAREVEDYIISERDRLAPLGSRLDAIKTDALLMYFKPHLLDSVRLVIGEPIREPDFAARLRAAGLRFPEFGLADAATLDRVVVANRPLSGSTLFHELVHVVQSRILGVDLFGQRYLLEYGSHGYDSMPLERLAVDLAHRYETGEKFSVEESLFDAL